MPEQSIQMNLFDYFKDNETFTIAEANEAVLHHYHRDVKVPSIRARIYEGIDKGIFRRVAKGVYTVTKDNNTCMVVNGNGRDLSFIKSGSIDAIITDHPYELKKSHTGGNRKIANQYETFRYNEADMKEKQRVLKPGGFLVELLPERNADNLEYLNEVIALAKEVGLEFYAVVPWKKGDFVINQGRKSKNTEDVYFFTNGKARNLRPDAKKNKAYEESHIEVCFKEYIPGGITVSYSDIGSMPTSNQTEVEALDIDIKIAVLKEDKDRAEALLEKAYENAIYDGYENSPLDKDYGGSYSLEELFDMPVSEYMLEYLKKEGVLFDDISKKPVKFFMSGAKGMLPTQFDVAVPVKAERIHQSEKPVALYEKIIEYTTLPGEIILDPFAGSGAAGKAALKSGRESILIEKDPIMCQKMMISLEPYGEVQDVSSQILEQLKKSGLYDNEVLTLSEFLKAFDFSYELVLPNNPREYAHRMALVKHGALPAENGFELMLKLVDLKGANIGDIEGERFLLNEDIVPNLIERLDVYVQDYVIKDFVDSLKEKGVLDTERCNLSELVSMARKASIPESLVDYKLAEAILYPESVDIKETRSIFGEVAQKRIALSDQIAFAKDIQAMENSKDTTKTPHLGHTH